MRNSRDGTVYVAMGTSPPTPAVWQGHVSYTRSLPPAFMGHFPFRSLTRAGLPLQEVLSRAPQKSLIPNS